MTNYYHGGAPGLKPGDRVLPASKTGAKSFGAIARDIANVNKAYEIVARAWRKYNPDKVYLASHYSGAFEYAQSYSTMAWTEGMGTVYLVQPSDDVREDPDPGSTSWGCPAYECDYATVIEILAEDVPVLPGNLAWPYTFAGYYHAKLVRGRTPSPSR